MTATDGKGLRLTGAQRDILNAASGEKSVIWPSGRVDSLRRVKSGTDGRTHYIAPVEDAFALFSAGLISQHGEITPAGHQALSSVGEGGVDG